VLSIEVNGPKHIFVTEANEIFLHKMDQINVGEWGTMFGSMNSLNRHRHMNISIQHQIMIQIQLRVVGMR